MIHYPKLLDFLHDLDKKWSNDLIRMQTQFREEFDYYRTQRDTALTGTYLSISLEREAMLMKRMREIDQEMTVRRQVLLNMLRVIRDNKNLLAIDAFDAIKTWGNTDELPGILGGIKWDE